MLMLGDMAVQKLNAADELVERFADFALNEDSFAKLGHAEPLMAQLSGGINETNALRRVQLLCQKMKTVPQDSWSLRSLGWRSRGYVTDQDRYLGEDRFAALLSCMIDSMKRASVLVPRRRTAGGARIPARCAGRTSSSVDSWARAGRCPRTARRGGQARACVTRTRWR